MLASLDEPPIAQKGLVYEPKYDGIRALVDIRPAGKSTGPAVKIYSRNGREKQVQFPEITAALERAALKIKAPVLVDGEIVAVNGDGQPLGFQHVQGRIHLSGQRDISDASRRQPAALVLFDLLRDGAHDWRGQPLARRRRRLSEIVRPERRVHAVVRLSEVVADDGRGLLDRARVEGWEGLIAKDSQSVYQSGRRTPAWRKLKLLRQQEFVIGGWTDPRQSRQHFGALLVGYHDKTGALRWAGAVGTGFDQEMLDRLAVLFKTREIARSPFADAFKTMERPHWVRPDLVAEVRFTEWTSDGLLRQPVFLGLRHDKSARDVRREDITIPPTPAVVRALPHRRNRRRREDEEASAAPRSAKGRRSSSPTPTGTPPAAFGKVNQRLEELEFARKDDDVVLPDGSRLKVTNLAKVFWPELGITKGELLRYYVDVAPLILPTVDDRPLVMKRFPNGITKQAFYQQRHPDAVPAGVRREALPPDIEPIDEEGPRDRLIGGNLATLLYMTQIAAISQDPWFSRVADPLHADFVAIDLDPGEGVPFARVVDVARWVKDELDFYQVPAVPKTSGSRGLHVYISLPAGTTYATGQLLCQMIATVVSTKHPRAATVERLVKRRARGTVYVDYLQNILGKTLATAYSARASDYAGVSTPLTWNEVGPALDPRAFTVRTAASRFRQVGDLWRPLRAARPVDIEALVRRHGARPARRKS
jgi:bifunctional non-homologous end joining protein LigD